MRARICGRLWLIDDEINAEFWCHELEPMDGGRGSAEWAAEHFGDYNSEYIRRIFLLADDKNYQILFVASLISTDTPSPSGEYSDRLVLEDVKTQEIPHDFARDFANYRDDMPGGDE